MPIYEYSCTTCGDRFEKLVKRSEEAVDAGCPSCGGHHLEQQYSTFAPRAGAAQSDSMPSCPGGMCGNPGMCGRPQ